MVRKISLRNFKGLDDLEVDGFGRINIFVGRNETGKSSILEALALCLSVQNDFMDSLGRKLLEQYFIQKYKTIKNLIKIGEDRASVNIDDSAFSIDINYEESGLSGNGYITKEIARVLDNIAKDYSIQQLIRNFRFRYHNKEEPEINEQLLDEIKQNIIDELIRKEAVVIRGYLKKRMMNVKLCHRESQGDILRPQRKLIEFDDVVDPDFRYFIDLLSKKEMKVPFIFYSSERRVNFKELHDLAVQKKTITEALDELRKDIDYFEDLRQIGGRFRVLSKDSKTAIPLEVRGDGLKSSIYMIFMENIISNGVIILEEPENYLHPGLMGSWCSGVLKKGSTNQYFISTHSSEVIEYILENEETRDDVRIFKLFKDPLDYEAMDGHEAYERLFEMKEDLRGI